jgi:uncharacterized protein (TIGR03083 family)
MPRPKTQADLLTAMDAELAKLEAQVAQLPPEQLTLPGVTGEWSVKDLFAHLTAWQQLVLGWHAAGKRGETPVTPAEDLTWAQIPELNRRIYEAHKDEPLDEVRAAFSRSAAECRAAVAASDDHELFAPRVYKWTKTTTLGAYYVSATSSHYLWARDEIRKWVKARARAG